MKYKALFISDVHIGSSHSKIKKLLNFLRDNEFEYIFLVGDIIDAWLLKKKWRWSADDNLFVQKILRQARNGTKIFYLYGNHDSFLKDFEGQSFGNIPIIREYVYKTHGNKYLIVHGDQFDGLIRFCPWLQRLGGLIYEGSMFLNGIIQKFGIEWSLSSFLKHKAKGAVNYISSYRNAIIEYTKEKGAVGIILGHIHHPEIKDIHGIKYMNIGDMVESHTVLVETVSGEFKIIKL